MIHLDFFPFLWPLLPALFHTTSSIYCHYIMLIYWESLLKLCITCCCIYGPHFLPSTSNTRKKNCIIYASFPFYFAALLRCIYRKRENYDGHLTIKSKNILRQIVILVGSSIIHLAGGFASFFYLTRENCQKFTVQQILNFRFSSKV